MRNAIHRMTRDEFLRAPRVERATLERARVVVPAKNVAGTLRAVLEYLRKIGFERNQVVVMVNDSEDETEMVATDAGHDGLALVYRQSQFFARIRSVLEPLLREYGVGFNQLHGKGTTLFAGLLALLDHSLHENDPITFLDSDLRGVERTDPVSCLLAGWQAWRPEAQMVKLVSPGRCDTDIRAALQRTELYHDLAALEWPLCGQVVMPWGVLKQMRLAAVFGVEMSELMDLAERYGSLGVFGEVEVPVPLEDAPRDRECYQRMHAGIVGFLQRYAGLTRLSVREIAERNHQGGEIDVLLPAVAEFMTRWR